MCNKQANQMKWNFTTLQKCNAICQWKLLLECLLTLPCEKLTPCTYVSAPMFLHRVSRNHVYFQTILLCIWGPKLYLSFSCFRTVVKKSSLLRETSCHASLYPAHIQYHPMKCKVQKHFISYVKLHFIFHQAFWMATLLMDSNNSSNNSLTSLLEQKRALKKIQAAASVSPCSMTVWPALEL